MSAGKLRESLSFQRRTEIDDGAGNIVAGDWVTVYGPAQARVQPLRGGEGVMAARLDGTQPFLVTIRSCAASRAITTDFRAVDARTGAIYNIRTNADTGERRQYLDLICEAGVAT